MKIVGQEKPSPEDLAHYGVKGMKWGVRRGGLGARFKGALLDRNQQKRAILTRRIEGRSKHLDEKIAGGLNSIVYMGRRNRDLVARMELNELRMQKNRIKKGQLKVTDYIEMLATTSVLDLVVSRRDNRG